MKRVDPQSPQGLTALADHRLLHGFDVTTLDEGQWRIVETVGGRTEIQLSRDGRTAAEAMQVRRVPADGGDDDWLFEELATLESASPAARTAHLQRMAAELLDALTTMDPEARAALFRRATALRVDDGPALRYWWATVAGSALVVQVATGGDAATLLLPPADLP